VAFIPGRQQENFLSCESGGSFAHVEAPVKVPCETRERCEGAHVQDLGTPMAEILFAQSLLDIVPIVEILLY